MAEAVSQPNAREMLVPPPSVAPVLGVGCGGSGLETITNYKALCIARNGSLDPAVRLLGFDVMAEPPFVNNNSGRAIRLTPGIEYLQLGRDCNPPALRRAIKTSSIDCRLREVLLRQPGGRLTRSLHNGSEGERLFGLLGLEWSRPDVRRMISAALTELSDLRLTAGRETGRDAPLLVIVAAGTAGGVGSSIALPIVADIKREADRLGIDPASCTFIGVAVLPEAFAPTIMRSSNAFDTISDYDHSQKAGVLPW